MFSSEQQKASPADCSIRFTWYHQVALFTFGQNRTNDKFVFGRKVRHMLVFV